MKLLNNDEEDKNLCGHDVFEGTILASIGIWKNTTTNFPYLYATQQACFLP
jgi:hypothetical protein